MAARTKLRREDCTNATTSGGGGNAAIRLRQPVQQSLPQRLPLFSSSGAEDGDAPWQMTATELPPTAPAAAAAT